MDLGLKEGISLVEYARGTIEKHLTNTDFSIPAEFEDLFLKKKSVFVRLLSYPKHALRGCAGYTEDILPLKESLKDVSVYASSRDKRFHPLRKSEFNKTCVEVSVLSRTKLLEPGDPDKYPGKIEIGKNGVIIEKNKRKGVMLPQMAIDSKWNAKQLLSHACMRADLPPDAWRDPDAKVYIFSARVFIEEAPGEKIIERKLTP